MNLHKAIRGRLVCLILVVLVLVSLIPIGVTIAQSGKSYHLTAVPSPAGDGVSSGGVYVLTQIEARASPHQSRGPGYFLAPFTPEEPQDNICVYLPVTLKGW
jgi:hypothetical protein